MEPKGLFKYSMLSILTFTGLLICKKIRILFI